MGLLRAFAAKIDFQNWNIQNKTDLNNCFSVVYVEIK